MLDIGMVEVQLEFFLRVIIACLCGMMIGYERKSRYKEAGIRTHTIVALGAALIMIVSKYGFSDVVEYDASRVAAQIVSGIGFLGAGIIFINEHTVSGLTTAAGIWATSGIGMAIGAGQYFIGIASAILVILIQFVMHRYSNGNLIERNLKLGLDIVQKDLLEDIHQLLAKYQLMAQHMNIQTTKDGYHIDIVISSINETVLQKLIGDMLRIEGMEHVKY